MSIEQIKATHGLRLSKKLMSIMLVYQYYPERLPLVKANIVMVALLAFIGEPFAVWFGIYYILNWKHVWSWHINTAMDIISKWATESILKLNPQTKRP